MTTSLKIRTYTDADWPNVWQVIEPTFRAGDSYPTPRDISEEDAKKYWTVDALATFVAESPNQQGLAGTYYMIADQPGLGDHICNCGYIVSNSHRRNGFGVELCKHSQSIAREMGFLGMRFNMVVAGNTSAVRAWQKAGLKIVGTVPNAFRHSDLGLQDVLVMYMDLSPTS